MKPILDTLSPETIETLLAWCEIDSFKDVSQRAAKPVAEGGLDLKISASSLCRLNSRHGIADIKDARAEYTELLQLPPGASLMEAAQTQLETRLFELSCRPNPGVAELRLLFQIITRLRALQLSERRVIVAEKREARASQPRPIHVPVRKILPVETIKHRVRVLLGKEAPDERDAEMEQRDLELKALERQQRREY